MENARYRTSDELEIKAALKKFIASYESNDRGGILSLFSPDFVDMSAGEPTRQGTAAKEWLLRKVAQVHAEFIPRLKINVHKVEVSGDLAYQRGDLVVTLVPRTGGDTFYIRQRFLEVWRRGPNGWKSVAGMDNE